jgi:hypothetical protein
MTERWWVDGDGLRGYSTDDNRDFYMREILELVNSRRGHIYIARPGGNYETKFAPIDPARARFIVSKPENAEVWVWANYKHDYPQEIHYAVLDNYLYATIVGPSENSAEGHPLRWELRRIAECGEEPL